MLIFVVFILPSELYTKTFKEKITHWLRLQRIRRRSTLNMKTKTNITISFIINVSKHCKLF